MNDTTEKLDLTKPSRALDGLVAEKVFEKRVEWRHREPCIRYGFGIGEVDDVVDYSSNFDSSNLVMHKMNQAIFSKRQRFLKELKAVIQKNAGIDVRWPDAVFMMKPRHICIAALKAVGAIE